jgi:hypothetical protein
MTQITFQVKTLPETEALEKGSMHSDKKKGFKMNPFSHSKHSPIVCNHSMKETRASAEALQGRESPFSAPNSKTVPKHAPNTDFHAPEKRAGEKQPPEPQTRRGPDELARSAIS